MNEPTRAAWETALMGAVVNGTVTDELTGDAGAYSWRVSNVTWDGVSAYLVVVCDNPDGHYRERPFDGSGSPTDCMHELGVFFAAQALRELETQRFSGLLGEVL